MKMSPSTFLYFAYGSNLLTKRIHINNPSAKFKNIGYLKDFKLKFMLYSQRWKGASATIVPSDNDSVWGVIWELDKSDQVSLDRQEGVDEKIYFPIMVDIVTPEKSILKCRVYQQWKSLENHSDDERPSPLYLETITKGAKEHNLPNEYIQFLQTFSDNGCIESNEMR